MIVVKFEPLRSLARSAQRRHMEMQCDPSWVLDVFDERDALAQRCAELEADLAEQADLLKETIEQRDSLDRLQSDECFRREKAEAERDTLRAEVVAYQAALADERGRHATAEMNLRAELDACMLLSKIEFDDCSEDTIKSRNAEIAKLNAEVERLTKIVGSQVVRRYVGKDQQRETDELVALGIEQDKQEIADLKARLLEAERGNEELVRLRAERRDLRALIAECDEYLNTNNLTSIGHGSILHRKMEEAAHD